MRSSMNQAAMKSWKDKLDEACKIPSKAFVFENYFSKERDDQLQKTGSASADASVDAQIKSNIDMALAKGKIAAVAYQPDFLLNTPKKEMHWSSVVGRMQGKSGACFYLIRNSWGNDCSRYKDQSNCKNGYIWVPQKDLINHTANVNSLR